MTLTMIDGSETYTYTTVAQYWEFLGPLKAQRHKLNGPELITIERASVSFKQQEKTYNSSVS